MTQTTRQTLRQLLWLLAFLLLPVAALAQDDDELQLGVQGKELKAPLADQYYYVRGDTVTYFADAFHLPEGAMLDRLLRKIPGVEYSSDGTIVIDETSVKEMRIAGKIFFKNVMSAVIKRIPMYCIEQVKFYDYDQAKRMNIILKKEYQGKWFAEFSAGFGPEGRYSEKVFAMKQTKKGRYTLYANANDINDTRQPGQETEWTPASLQKNQVTSQFLGGDYFYKQKTWDATGYVTLNHSITDAVTNTDRTNLLVDGNTFQSSTSVSRKRSFKLNTYHDIHLKVKAVDIHFKPKFTYNDTDNDATTTSTTMAEDSTLINSSESSSATKSYDWSAQLVASAAYKFDHKRKQLKVEGGYTYSQGQERETTDETIHYLLQDSLYHYDQNLLLQPQRKVEAYWKNEYQWTGKGFLGVLQYQYKYTRTHEDQSELVNGLATNNDYGSREATGIHSLIAKMHYERPTAAGTWTVNIYAPLEHNTRHIDFAQADYTQDYRKHYLSFNLKNTYLQWRSPDTQHRVTATLDITTKTPDYEMLQEVVNSTNKKTYYVGNPNVQNQVTQQYRLQYAYFSLDTRYQTSLLLMHKRVSNSIVSRLTYDYQTGTKTYTYDNASGVRSTSAWFTLGLPLNRQTTLYLHNDLETSLNRKVSLEATGSTVNTKKADVYAIDDDLRLKWHVANQILTLRTRFQMSYSDNGSSISHPIDWSTGLLAQLNLPWRLGLSTDFSMYKRHNYTSTELNTTDWVWNARLTRLFLKDKLLIVVEGFDILQQLKNVTHTVSSDAIVNTRTNVIPSYAMVCLVYRLGYKAPKKRGTHWF